MMRVRPGGRMLPGMNILPIPRILVVALAALAVMAAAVIASPSEASHYGAKHFTLTGKTLAVEQVDVGKPGPSLGDRQILTEDVYRGDKRVGTSDIECTVVRVELPKFAAQCFNTTSLPGARSRPRASSPPTSSRRSRSSRRSPAAPARTKPSAAC